MRAFLIASSTLLDEAERREYDPQVLDMIIQAKTSVEEDMRMIAEEMELDNPLY
jgi:hypothetical protein